jgi:hypothetical protein
MSAMRCRYSEEASKVVLSYLFRTGQSLRFHKGRYLLVKGAPNVDVIEDAFWNGAIHLTSDGFISICGITIKHQWDTDRIRHRIEDYLRKSASKGEIIRIAVCLGIRMS